MSDTPEDGSDIAAETVAIAPTSMSVGRRLRSAREATGQSVADVAQAIKYSPRQIELLEADNYASLPGITVVRGFVRSYGRYLQLDVDGLLRVLEDRLPNAQADVRPPENMGAAVQPGSGRELSMVAALALVVALAAFLLVLWHYFGPSVTKPTASASSAATATSDVATATPQPTIFPAAVPTQDSPAPAVAQEEREPSLRFTFEGRSWVEVTDATRKAIYSGENIAGSELKLEGNPPFDIVVGNAPKVKLMRDGRPVDLAPHTRADVARLKLD